MLAKDIHSEVTRKVLIPASNIKADNTPAAVDCSGFRSVEILIDVGVGGITFDDTNKVEFKLTKSNASDGSFVAVTDDDILGADVDTGGIIKSLEAAHAAGGVYRFGYVDLENPFLKLLADFSGTHGTETPLAASVLLASPVAYPTPLDDQD